MGKTTQFIAPIQYISYLKVVKSATFFIFNAKIEKLVISSQFRNSGKEKHNYEKNIISDNTIHCFILR